ncbi:MAG: TonB-dependent receptor, partial [Candidatus Binatia bacterium]
MKRLAWLRAIGWIVGAVLVADVVHAAEGKVETITVIGKRLEEDLPQELARTGIRVDTIGSSELKNGGYVDVSMPLQSLGRGFYVAPKNGRFDYVDLSYQGSRTQDVLWLVDGVRINNRLYAGTTPLDTIPASMVERIEILEGGQALFYGTQAVAGAVNIVTKDFTDAIDGAISLGGGTQDQRHVDGYVRGSLPGSNRFVLYASHDQSDGFQPFPDSDYRPSSTDRHRDYNVTGVGGKYARDFGEALRFTAGYHHTDAKLDFAQPTLVHTAFNERDEDLLHAKIDYAFSDRVELFLKGYYHWWKSHFTEIDNELDESGMPTGTLTTIDDEAPWGFRDYGTNALAKVGVFPGLESLLGYD